MKKFKKQFEKKDPKEIKETPKAPQVPKAPRFGSPLDVIDAMISNLKFEGAMNKPEERLEKVLTSKHRNDTWQFSAIMICIDYLMKIGVIK